MDQLSEDFREPNKCVIIIPLEVPELPRLHTQRMVADAFRGPDTFLGSADVTVYKVDKISPSRSPHSGGAACLNPPNDCAELTSWGTKKAFDRCKHSLNVWYCCSEMLEELIGEYLKNVWQNPEKCTSVDKCKLFLFLLGFPLG